MKLRPFSFSQRWNFGSRIPFGVPEIVLAGVVFLSEFIFSDEPVTLPSVSGAIIGVLLVAAAPHWPLAIAALSVPFAALSSYVAGETTTFSIFFIIILLELVTASGLAAVGLMLVLIHTALSTVDFSTLTIATEPVVAVMMLILLSTSYLIGRNRLLQAANAARLRRSLADSQRTQRLGLARELHDSVATALTGVVMRSQALELTATGEENATVREGLEDISHTSRAALEQLRTMLRLLNSETDFTDAPTSAYSTHRTVRAALNATARELRAYGLRVHTQIDLPRAEEPLVDREALTRILTEMTSNAVKHSPDRAEVLITCHHDTQEITVSMENPIRSEHRAIDPILTSSLGLGSMIARAQAAGGELVAGPQPREAEGSGPEVWQTTVSLPIVSDVTTPRRSP